MIDLHDYCEGVMVAHYGQQWEKIPEGQIRLMLIKVAVSPLLERIATLMQRCRVAGIDVSDLED